MSAPALLHSSPTQALYRAFAEVLQGDGFRGDVQLDFGSRTVQSTDNSIYQRFPEGLLYPAEAEDLIKIGRLASESRFRAVHFCPRGGGTSTNGQALGDGFVVDLSRHMTHILEINVEQGWARVQAGVVKDQLNAAVRDHGLFFAPDLSTSNRATIGGMINTDASGQGSCRYGKTRDHVLEIEAVLADGSVWHSAPLGQNKLLQICSREDRIGEAHRLLADIADKQRDLISETFPLLNRSLTGYDLAHLYTLDGRFDLNSLWSGSEGSLGFVTEAKVKLEVLPRYRALLVVYYADFVAALRHSRVLMASAPTAVETIDDNIVALAREDAMWPRVAEFFDEQSAQKLAAVNFVEFSEHSDMQLDHRLAACLQILQSSEGTGDALGHTVVRDPESISTLWTMRKRAVGLLGNTPGDRRPLPFVEDSAVPPENLPDYIAAFRQILDREQLHYGMFGHADAGVIHVRPALDMRDPESLSLVRRISDDVFDLARHYGGVLWGEHGKGLRSEYSPATFGALYPHLQRIKSVFDPHNQLNPGKIATPSENAELLRIDGVSTRGERDRLIPTAVWNDYPGAVHCNGNGACFNWDPDEAMCPSWKGTRERKYSPKGRAALMKEWLIQQSTAGTEPRAAISAPSLGKWPQRLWNTARSRLGLASSSREEFGHQVRDSMDHCLACKACTTGCPVQVDVPAFRSFFLQHYFQRYLRPPRHLAVASLETWLPRLTEIPVVYNMLTQSRAMQFLLEKGLGLSGIPAMPSVNVYRRLPDLGVQLATKARLDQLTEDEKHNAVVIVPDVFTFCFEPALVQDTCRLLRELGFTVWLAPYRPNGKPLHVLGFLKRFAARAQAQSQALMDLQSTGVQLVGLEPSMTLTYRQEYRQFLGAVPEVGLLQEWLSRRMEKLQEQGYRFKPGKFKLLAHCSEAATASHSLRHWQSVFAALGSELAVESVGCCGMAGTYGHETAHLANSRRIYALSWEPKLSADDACRNDSTPGFCASGFSCRSQVKRFGKRQLPHPVQCLLAQLRKAPISQQ